MARDSTDRRFREVLDQYGGPERVLLVGELWDRAESRAMLEGFLQEVFPGLQKDGEGKPQCEECPKAKGHQEEYPKGKGHQEECPKSKGHQEVSLMTKDHLEESNNIKGHHEECPKTKDHREESSKTKDHQESSKTKDHQEVSSKTMDHQEESNNIKGQHEECPKTKDHQEVSSKTKVYQEVSSKTKDHQEESSKTKDHQEESSKTKDHQEVSSKTKDHQEVSSKTKDHQEVSSKTKDHQEVSSKTKDHQEVSSKTKDHQEVSSKTKDHQEECPKTKDHQSQHPVPDRTLRSPLVFFLCRPGSLREQTQQLREILRDVRERSRGGGAVIGVIMYSEAPQSPGHTGADIPAVICQDSKPPGTPSGSGLDEVAGLLFLLRTVFPPEGRTRSSRWMEVRAAALIPGQEDTRREVQRLATEALTSADVQRQKSQEVLFQCFPWRRRRRKRSCVPKENSEEGAALTVMKYSNGANTTEA
ncbi:uncharacterized protein C2orf72 homolog [Discoglossus pictus]